MSRLHRRLLGIFRGQMNLPLEVWTAVSILGLLPLAERQAFVRKLRDLKRVIGPVLSPLTRIPRGRFDSRIFVQEIGGVFAR